jgi:hypothetical protein
LLDELGAASAQSLDYDPDLWPISVEEAEIFAGDGDEAYRTDPELIEERGGENVQSSIAKVCCCVFVSLSSVPQRPPSGT